jgi:hypothetical protein
MKSPIGRAPAAATGIRRRLRRPADPCPATTYPAERNCVQKRNRRNPPIRRLKEIRGQGRAVVGARLPETMAAAAQRNGKRMALQAAAEAAEAEDVSISEGAIAQPGRASTFSTPPRPPKKQTLRLADSPPKEQFAQEANPTTRYGGVESWPETAREAAEAQRPTRVTGRRAAGKSVTLRDV